MNKLQPKTQILGKNIVYLTSCHSTNDYASELIQKNQFFNGTIVITENQTSGKGQRGNVWLSEANKNLMFSIILQPDFLPANEQFNLNIAVSLGIQDCLENYLKENLSIKWPNDIFFVDKKIGGVLIENTLVGKNINTSIIGIGININQSDFLIDTASSLLNILGKEQNIRAIAESLFEKIEKRYLQLMNNEIAILKEEYVSKLYRINRKVLFKDENGTFEGEIVGISEFGKLNINRQNFVKSYDIKEIAYLM